MGFGPDSEELREIMVAYGRQQAAFADETARFFMEVDLTMAQFRALAAIRRFGTLSGRELAARLKITPGTLVPLMDRLEQLDYVRRVPDREDRRLTWLELTPKGHRLFHRLWLSGAAKVARAVGRLPAADRTALKRLLNQIAGELEGDAEGETPVRAPYLGRFSRFTREAPEARHASSRPVVAPD